MPTESTGAPCGRTVLVVDDDAGQRSCLVELLALSGYRVVVASDGQEALDLLRGGLAPAVIVLDLSMPRMDGWAFLERLRGAERSTIPVVVTSADVRARPPEGADVCIEKPIEPRAFGETVARLSAAAGPAGS
jgi:CheY-like chemotaxis protein